MAFTTDFDKMVINSVDTITGVNRTTSEIVFMYDEIQNATIENAGELVFGEGANGRRISSLQKNKTSTLTFTNGYVVISGLAAKIGATVTEATEDSPFSVPTVEFLTVTGDTTKTASFPTGRSADVSTVKYIYKANKDMTQGARYDLTTDFTVTADAITITTDEIVAGDTIIVLYNYNTTVGKKVSNDSEKYAQNVKLVADILCSDICDNSITYHARMVYYNTIPDMNNSISIGDDSVVEEFSAEAMVDPCSTEKLYWDIFIVE